MATLLEVFWISKSLCFTALPLNSISAYTFYSRAEAHLSHRPKQYLKYFSCETHIFTKPSSNACYEHYSFSFYSQPPFQPNSPTAIGHSGIVRPLILKMSQIHSRQIVYYEFVEHVPAFAIVRVIYYFIVVRQIGLNG